VQAGSWQNLPSRLLSASADGPSGSAARLRASAVPRNWGGQGLVGDVVMGSEYALDGSGVLSIDYSITYRGAAPQPRRMQELPAVFLDRRLSVLALYDGPAPWSGAPPRLALPGERNTEASGRWRGEGCCGAGRGRERCAVRLGSLPPPRPPAPPHPLPWPPRLPLSLLPLPAPPKQFFPTEKWAAYLDPSTGAGLGVFVPRAERLTAYRVGPDNSTAVSDTSYLAPLAKFAVPTNGTFSYRAYIAAGRLGEIRAAFARLAARHGLARPEGGGKGGGKHSGGGAKAKHGGPAAKHNGGPANAKHGFPAAKQKGG
jgi:hypothetical protein